MPSDHQIERYEQLPAIGKVHLNLLAGKKRGEPPFRQGDVELRLEGQLIDVRARGVLIAAGDAVLISQLGEHEASLGDHGKIPTSADQRPDLVFALARLIAP